jgi:hypothetical protein
MRDRGNGIKMTAVNHTAKESVYRDDESEGKILREGCRKQSSFMNYHQHHCVIKLVYTTSSHKNWIIKWRDRRILTNFLAGQSILFIVCSTVVY